MPEINSIMLAVGGGGLALGVLIGWLLRSVRVKPEKDAIHAGWQEQISAQRNEHDRIVQQNKSLMEQVSQFRASQRDADGRAREISNALKRAIGDCDELTTELSEANANLEAAAAERDELKAQIADRKEADNQLEALRDKDRKIFRLSEELETWKNRLPPLIEKFRNRDLEAQQLEVELEAARGKAAELEARLEAAQQKVSEIESAREVPGEQTGEKTGDHQELSGEFPTGEERPADETRVEPVEDQALAAGMSASNEQFPEDTLNGASVRLTALDSANRAEDTLRESTIVENGHINANGDDAQHDDLKRIKGVGPAIEKTLLSLGFTRIAQIAEMSDGDIDRVADELPGFKNRIHREDWIGQARQLLEEQPAS